MNSFSYHASLLSYDYLLDKAPTSQERKGEYYLHMHNDYEILFSSTATRITSSKTKSIR